MASSHLGRIRFADSESGFGLDSVKLSNVESSEPSFDADSLAKPEVLSSKYDTRCYFNVRSKADISQLNLPHGTDN